MFELAYMVKHYLDHSHTKCNISCGERLLFGYVHSYSYCTMIAIIVLFGLFLYLPHQTFLVFSLFSGTFFLQQWSLANSKSLIIAMQSSLTIEKLFHFFF